MFGLTATETFVERNTGSLNVLQQAKGETKTITTWEYPNGLQIMIAVCHFDWSPGLYSLFRVLGTDGLIEGTIGTNYDYPNGRSDTLKFTELDSAGTRFFSHTTRQIDSGRLLWTHGFLDGSDPNRWRTANLRRG